MSLRLADIERIKRLKYRYCRGIDMADFELLRELFTEDVAVDYVGATYRWQLSGREAMLAAHAGSFNANTVASHTVHHPEIDVLDDSTAVGSWYLADFYINLAEQTLTTGAALQRDRYVRQDGDWLIGATSSERLWERIEPFTDPSQIKAHYLARVPPPGRTGAAGATGSSMTARNDMALRLEDIELIQRLKHKYLRCVDTANIEELRDLFTEDITVDFVGATYRWQMEGREAFLAGLKAAFHPRGVASHVAHHPEIDVLTDTTAEGRWYLTDFFIDLGANQLTTGTVLYRDEYVKLDGAWRIKLTSYQRIYERVEPFTGHSQIKYSCLAKPGSVR